MRVVFLASGHFGLECLKAGNTARGCEIAGVVTLPETFSISYRPDGVKNVLHTDIPGFCAAASIPCMEMPGSMKDAALLAAVSVWKPDVFVVAGWYHMVPSSWRSLAPAYGLHGSLLPHYRGGAPVVWAIINGERKTGVTLFRFDGGVDTGPVLAQAETAIDIGDDIATVYARIRQLGAELVRTHLPTIADGTAVLQVQVSGIGSHFPQRSPGDGLIDWSWAAPRIHDFVRAQTHPYPGAFFFHLGQKICVWKTEIHVGASGLRAGELCLVDEQLVVGAGNLTQLRLVDVSVGAEDFAGAQWWHSVSRDAASREISALSNIS